MATAKHDYDMAVYPVQVAVRSASDGAAVHMVTLPHCDCADFTNRKGRLVEVEFGGVAVLVCKHIAAALGRVGGWHRDEPAEETVTYHRLPRIQAVTLMTSAHLAADLVDRLLRAAVGAGGLAVTVTISTGSVLVKYDSPTRGYTVTLPARQPVALPA
jgi:hypothetical protein